MVEKVEQAESFEMTLLISSVGRVAWKAEMSFYINMSHFGANLGFFK